MPEAAARLRDTALRLLGRREHSAQELAGKLASRHSLPVGSPEIRQLLLELQQGGYLCEQRFVESFVRERRLRGYGPARIEQELRLRGINEETIAASVDRSDPEWQTLALSVRRKRFGEQPVTLLKDKARVSRFLQYRGFLGDQIRHAL